MPSTSLAELSGLLWRERDLLDQLLSVLRAGGEHVETAGLLRSISSLELHRAITAREVALELGLEGEPTLQELVARSEDEWAVQLASHRRALQELSDEVGALLRRVPARSGDGNVVTLRPRASRSVQRSLRDFLD